MLEGLELGVYRFVMRPIDPLHLPEYKGGILRGGFGTTFKSLTCFKRPAHYAVDGYRSMDTCIECPVAAECPYKTVFEPSPREGTERLRNLQDIPRPFVFRSARDPRTVIEPGQHFEWEMVVVGSALKYIPYFVITMKILGEGGFGLWHDGKRARVELESVYSVNPLTRQRRKVFDGASGLVDGSNHHIVTGEAIERFASSENTDIVIMNFLSITRLKYQNEFVRTPDFHVLVRNLLRRLSTLSYFYQGRVTDLDFTGLINRAEAVSHENISIRWQGWERYSGRSKSTMNFSGLVGQVRYCGDLVPFLALLIYGSIVHVGKGATFGLGHYAIEQ